MRRFFLRMTFVLTTLAAVFPLQSFAEDFRIENRVFFDKDANPTSESVTVFRDGIVYDFLKKPAEVTILDKTAEKVILLNQSHKIRTEVSGKQLDAVLSPLKEAAAKSKDPLMSFYGEPLFSESFDPVRNELTLTSPLVSYRVACVTAESSAVASQFRDFSDWLAKVNTLLAAGARLPYPRFKLNEALEKREMVPKEVTLTLTNISKGKENDKKNPLQITHRTEHVFEYKLTAEDGERLRKAKEQMSSFKLVTIDEFRKKTK